MNKINGLKEGRLCWNNLRGHVYKNENKCLACICAWYLLKGASVFHNQLLLANVGIRSCNLLMK